MTKFLECFAPEDFMMQIFVKDLTNYTWDIRRIQRHMTLNYRTPVSPVSRIPKTAETADSGAKSGDRPALGETGQSAACI